MIVDDRDGVKVLAREEWRRRREEKEMKLKQWQIALIVIASVVAVIVIVFGSIAAAMAVQLKDTGNLEYGRDIYQANVKSGKVEASYKVYSPEEIADNGTKSDVKLYWFPAENTTDKTNYVVICPGGGYMGARADSAEGYPVAATFADMGYTAFVLEYRTGDDSFSEQYSQVKDLAAAVKYINDNSVTFNVKTDGYAVCGFSAGGHVVGLYGTESVGYANYDAPAPSVIIMGYGLINVTNLQIEAKYVIGKDAKKADREAISTDLLINANYPPIYFWQAKNDILFGNLKYSNRLDAALNNHDVYHEYAVYKTGQHTCGLGIGTSAEGWIYNAMAFWKRVIA